MRNNKTLCLKLVSLFCFRKEDKSFWKSFVTLRCATLCATAAAAAGISSWTGRSRDGWMDDTASQLLLVRYCSSILLSLVQLVVAATAATLSLGTFLIPQSSHYKHNINYQFQAGTLTAACSVTLLHWAPLFLNTPCSPLPCPATTISAHCICYYTLLRCSLLFLIGIIAVRRGALLFKWNLPSHLNIKSVHNYYISLLQLFAEIGNLRVDSL